MDFHQSPKQHAGRFAPWQPRGQFPAVRPQRGTLGLYTPAGAGILLDNDGSARFGQATAHMLWDSASSSLKFISGLSDEGPIIAAEIDTNGNAPFVGNITATGGRITGDMQVDARLRAGDVDGPAVYIGKSLTNEDGSAYAGQILVTDTENVPWFSVTTGNDGTGHLQIGRPGNYPNRLTLDVTATGSTLVYDGLAYPSGGAITGELTVSGTRGCWRKQRGSRRPRRATGKG